MKYIDLNNSPLKVMVDDEDFRSVSRHTWYYAINVNNSVMVINEKNIHLTRFLIKTELPHIDHINHDKLDFQRHNLRPATRSQNAGNSRKKRITKSGNKPSSQFKGVCWSKHASKWRANIMFNRTSIHLGYFSNEIKAAEAYNVAAKFYFGEFALLNRINT